MSKLFLILTISIAAFFIWSGRALAQGPTWTTVISYTFASSSEADDFSGDVCWSNDDGLPPPDLKIDLNITDDCPFPGSDAVIILDYDTVFTRTYPADKIRIEMDSYLSNFYAGLDYRAIAIIYTDSSEDEYQSSDVPGGGWQHFGPIQGDTGKFIGSFEFRAHADGTNAEIMQFDNIHIELSDAETSCSLVPNPDFATNDNWTLSGSATITNSILSLTYPDYAVQSIGGLQADSTYDLTLIVSSSTDGALDVSLGDEIVSFLSLSPGVATAQLTTPPTVAGPLQFKIQNINGQVDIDFACLSLASTGPGGEQNACIAPTNGEFTTAANWDFYRGASWLPATKNASLPAANSGLARDAGDYELPSLAGGEYLLLSFEAVATSGDNGLIGANIDNGTLDFTGYFETYQTMYTFEADVSSLAGESFFDIAFANVPTDTLTADIELDNVCIFVSDRLPNLPQPTDTGGWTPVDLDSGWYNCSDVETYVYANTGVDLRYHQANYANTPGAWDFSDWVPWLISWGWVTFETAVCLTLVLFHTLVNLLEYILNNGLNIFAWGRANAINFVPWMYDWLVNFDLSWDNLGNWLLGTAENWLTWAALAVIEFALAYGSIFENLATLALWFGAGFIWLGGLLADGNNLLRGILNTLIDDGWNGFLTSVGNVLSTLIDLLIRTIWNGGLLAFMQAVLPGFLSGPLSFINLVPLLWSLVWSVVMYLWVNVFQMINIPFAFYTGLSDGIQSTAFSDLASCNGSTQDFFCGVFAALDLVNGVAGHSIFYPIVIVGVIIGTIAILYRNFIALWNFYADWLTRL